MIHSALSPAMLHRTESPVFGAPAGREYARIVPFDDLRWMKSATKMDEPEFIKWLRKTMVDGDGDGDENDEN